MTKEYSKIIIKENHEPLVAIPSEKFVIETPHPYEKLGANYQGKSPYFLRETVLNNLIQAQSYLQEIKPNWKIKIFDAYRPVEVQEFMVNYAFNDLLKSRNLEREKLSEIEEKKIWSEVYQMWALPSLDPKTPPPHSTGAAVDITLVDDLGNTIDMGGEIDEISSRSNPNYYNNFQNKKEEEFNQLRTLLNKIMIKANFTQHSLEWWHFSHGDQMYVWYSSQNNLDSLKSACYGRV